MIDMGRWSRKTSVDIWSFGLFFVVCYLLFSFFKNAVHLYINDSEIWAVALARQFPGWWSHNSSFLHKFWFYATLKIAYLGANSSADVFLFSRIIFAGIGGGIVVLCGRLSWIIYRSKVGALLTVILLLSSTLFSERGFRIRADLLVCFLNLLAMNILLPLTSRPILPYDREQGPPAHLPVFKRTVVVSSVNVLMLLSTPKAWFTLVLQFIFVVYGRSLGVILLDSKKIFLLYGLPVTALAMLVSISFFSPGFPHFFESYQVALDYFKQGFEGSESIPMYMSQASFQYVLQFIKDHRLLSCLIAIWTVAIYWQTIKVLLPKSWSLQRKDNHNNPLTLKKAFQTYALLNLLFIFLYNDRLPFFLAAHLPIILAACCGDTMAFLNRIENKSMLRFFQKSGFHVFFKKQKISLIMVASLMIFGWYILHSLTLAFSNDPWRSNQHQLVALRELEQYLSPYPNINYFDGTGILPLLNFDYIYSGPGVDRNQIISRLYQEKPQVVFLTRKATALEPAMMDYLRGQNYLHVGSGVLVQGARLDPTSIVKTSISTQKKVFHTQSIDQIKTLLNQKFENWLRLSSQIYLYHLANMKFVSSQDSVKIQMQLNGGQWVAWTNGIVFSKLLSEVKLVRWEFANELGVSIFPPLELNNGYSILELFNYH